MHPQLFRRAVCSSFLTTSLFISPALAGVAGEPLTLPRALALVLRQSPELAGFAAEIRAREARALQAGLLPNPELRTDLENVGGTGDRERFEQTETTVRLTQLIELAGKRGKRRRVAELGRDLAGWDYEAKKLAVLSDATKAFVHALGAQERLRLAEELEQLARRAVQAVGAQVEAGASPAVEVSRARVTLGRSEVARRRAERELAAANTALAATWGDDRPTFGSVEGNLAGLGTLPSPDEVLGRIEENPDLARRETELEERKATLALEEAGRIPDVTVGAGGRHFSDNDDNALVFELSVPLPVFDQNQGGIGEAHQRLEKARAEKNAAGVALRVAVAAAYAELASSHEQATRLREDVLPEAQRSFDGARDAYEQGLFRFVDVLDAQRTLFELRAEYLTALQTFHVQAAEVERLTGSALSEPRPTETSR